MIRAAALAYAEGLLSSDQKGRKGVRVFCYHGVVERKADSQVERNLHVLSNFREQVAYLRRYRVLDLEGLLEEMRRPDENAPPAAVVTFDDACASTLLAGEVLARQKVPWFMFVPSGEIGLGRALWTVDLSLLLLHGDARHLEILGRRWNLSTRDEREAAFQTLRYEIKSLAADVREAAMERIREQFPAGDSERLVAKFPAFRMLSWEEVGGFASAGVEIGSHGVYHELHHALQPPEVRRRELVESKKEIEARIGRPCRSFSYPNGDYVTRSASEVRDAGYTVGFTTWPGTIMTRSSPFLLCRMHPPGSLPKFMREYWWQPVYEVPETLPKISVEQRQSHLRQLLASGKASRGVALPESAGELRPVQRRAADDSFDFANPPKLARAVAILEGLAAIRLREPRIVDLGCGSGWLTGILGTFGPTVGVSLSTELVPETQQWFGHLELAATDLFQWDYPPGAFDVVISHQVLEKVPDPERYLEIAHDLLRPGGYIILTTHNARTVEAIAPDDRAGRPDPGETPLPHKRLRSLLERQFRIQRLRTIVPNYGSRGFYRAVNSRRLREVLAGIGLGPTFERVRLERGYGLHTVVIARKS
jgi:SAM-dependent methyltransferase/peptidoglycan/xylan/chitin deacetylase (PgdA/CDA1 family)